MSVQDLDHILAEMGEVLDQLSALPDDAFSERQQLEAQQARLRVRAAEIRESVPLNRRELEAELDGLIVQWDALQDKRIDVVMQSGGGSHGGDAFSGVYAMELNKKIDDAQGRDGIEARIKEIRILLGESVEE